MRGRFALLFAAAALLWAAWAGAAPPGAPARLLRFPDVWHDRLVFTYAGDLWTVGTEGGAAVRLTSSPGLELFAKFSPDGRRLAFTAQYGGDEQVYVMPAGGGVPQQLTFYPATGPLADRWGFDNQVYGWTPDGTRVLFRSARDAFLESAARLYTVPAAGGAATALPMPVSGAGDLSPDGKRIVYSPLWRDFRSEKRYQGGWANELYVFDLEKPAALRITADPRTDRDPMWIGDAIYFNSDRGGMFNLYRYDITTRETRQITHHQDWDVRWPSADGAQIVYECGGELRLYDTRNDTEHAVDITVPTDGVSARARTVNAADLLEGHALSPSGERIAVVARGDVYTVPVENGVTRNLTHSSNAHDREVAWSSDGHRLAYISDLSGEEELVVQAEDGATPAEPLTFHSSARYSAPRWSTDDRRIAYADQTGRLHVVELPGPHAASAPAHSTVIAQDPVELAHDYQWSPDGQYLSYSINDPNGFSGVYVWSVADGRSRRITRENVDAFSPAWAPAGGLLYYLGAHEYAPLMSSSEFDYATDRQIGIFAVTLRPDVHNPYGVRDDEPGSPSHAKSAKGIDFAGIVNRTIRVPVEADNLTSLHVTDENLVYQRNGPTYYGREPPLKPAVIAYSIAKREPRRLVDDVADWSLSADGKHLLVQLGSKELKVFDVSKADETDGEDAKSVSLAGLVTRVNPTEEWHEIFVEVWRRYRDFFYVANMHGYDWQALRRKYEPLVDAVGQRADLNYVIAEMIAELTVQHAYIEGGDLGLPKRPYVALPGARLALDAATGRYRIAKIFAGDNAEEHYRSPLTEVGVDAQVGDYVLAINGRELGADIDPYALLQTPANQPVEWRVAPTADGRKSRTIRYRPLASETALLYREWAEGNRARVAAASHGRVGYIHLPDMGDAGLREFIKGWYPQVRKEALLIDVRDNGGGNISEMLIERLARTLHGTRYARNQAVAGTYPRNVGPAPKAALINESTASDGDIFAHQFREYQLGPLIGKRTWGGVVGIEDHGPLLDGGSVYVPEFGTADSAGRWIIEGHGVDPDVEVDQDPLAVIAGHDPQLERGIAELLQRLPSTPAGLPPRPAAPVKTESPGR